MKKFVPRVMSVMTSCGMYDYSGSWLFNTGMPAKSGVDGGVLAVLLGQIGLAAFSPKLDIHGNSVRGLAACARISDDFGFHILRVSAYLSCITAGMKVSTHHSEKGCY